MTAMESQFLGAWYHCRCCWCSRIYIELLLIINPLQPKAKQHYSCWQHECPSCRLWHNMDAWRRFKQEDDAKSYSSTVESVVPYSMLLQVTEIILAVSYSSHKYCIFASKLLIKMHNCRVGEVVQSQLIVIFIVLKSFFRNGGYAPASASIDAYRLLYYFILERSKIIHPKIWSHPVTPTDPTMMKKNMPTGPCIQKTRKPLIN
jgi:hypothetical protein